jgi:Methyltransferase domain
MVACLEAAAPRSVIEIGAYAGDLTALLLDWAADSGARIIAVDPAPQPELARLAEEHPDLDLIRETSPEALRRVPEPGAVFIDGDHNYYTVTEELRLIAEAAGDGELPLLLFHDVCWPHARRDDYYDPARIPEAHRHPIAEGAGIFPGIPDVRPGGLPYHYPAAREGGPRNGVLTAIEDFLETREDLRLAIVPAFFGLGVVWPRDVAWAEAVAEVVEPWDRNPLLERLEDNRVDHLATSHVQLTELGKARERVARQETVLRRLLESSAFSVAERLSRLRFKMGIGTHQQQISKEDLRRALSD